MIYSPTSTIILVTTTEGIAAQVGLKGLIKRTQYEIFCTGQDQDGNFPPEEFVADTRRLWATTIEEVPF